MAATTGAPLRRPASRASADSTCALLCSAPLCSTLLCSALLCLACAFLFAVARDTHLPLGRMGILWRGRSHLIFPWSRARWGDEGEIDIQRASPGADRPSSIQQLRAGPSIRQQCAGPSNQQQCAGGEGRGASGCEAFPALRAIAILPSSRGACARTRRGGGATIACCCCGVRDDIGGAGQPPCSARGLGPACTASHSRRSSGDARQPRRHRCVRKQEAEIGPGSAARSATARVSTFAPSPLRRLGRAGFGDAMLPDSDETPGPRAEPWHLGLVAGAGE